MTVICGVCRTQHDSTEEVKACYAKKYGGFKELAVLPTYDELQGRQEPDLAELQASIDHHPSVVATLSPIPEGYFTVVFGEDDRITLRVRTQDADAQFAPGKQIISYLSGPDNTSDYRGFAFADATTGHVNFWKRFKGNDRLDLAVRTLQDDPEACGLAFAEESGNCWMCNRLLTVPASIHRGLGPICAGKRMR